ncbi:hypothetical protein SISNIDRAFT_453121 [Sistotremastrum niveocremeum HHB9708]|uniref:Uncharacterized protein n=1 Tax=Sistotremastrum niveocremeum HHB9708 TaxID=1314777 RepID=A0A164WD89_9AGAM|nr:hypothetical protein SISNIDRAFT_453121 [Sistotremastrum niveocremeum HHB9708]
MVPDDAGDCPSIFRKAEPSAGPSVGMKSPEAARPEKSSYALLSVASMSGWLIYLAAIAPRSRGLLL